MRLQSGSFYNIFGSTNHFSSTKDEFCYGLTGAFLRVFSRSTPTLWPREGPPLERLFDGAEKKKRVPGAPFVLYVLPRAVGIISLCRAVR